MIAENVRDFFKNKYGKNIDRPDHEQFYMDQLGFTRSKQAATLKNLLGYKPEDGFPVPGIMDHAMLYNHNGKPHTIVLQPYKSNIKITAEIRRQLQRWCAQHNLLVDINQMPAWYAPDRCHVIELSNLPH